MSSTVVSSKLYDIMCLPQFSTIAEVRTAYKTLALKYHPDKNLGDPEAANKFRVVKEAYELLSDEGKKKKYDLRLQMAMRTSTTSKNAAQSPSSLSSTYKAFFQMNNLSPTRRQRRTDTSTKGRGSATGTASRGPAAASTNPTAPSGSTPGYSTNDGTRSRAVPKTEEKNATGAAAAESRPPRTASRRRNMEDSMGSSSTAAGNARGTNADASYSFSNSFRSFPSGLGGRGGSRVPPPQQSAPFHADSSSPPPLHRPTKLSPEERLRRVKEAQRAEQEKQAEIQRRRDAEKALRRQREELREEQRRKREEERRAKEKEEQERSKREYERWQEEWEKEEQERHKRYADREARHQHQEQGAEALLNEWKEHRQHSSLFSRQKPPRRTMSSLTSSSDLRAGNSPASWSPSETPAEPGSPEYDVEKSPDGSGPPHFFSSSASSLPSFSQEWRLPQHRKGEHERDSKAFPSSLGSVEEGRGATLSSLFHSAHPESGVPRVIRRPGYPSKGQDSGSVADDPTSSAYVLAQKRGVVKRSAHGTPPSFMASPQDDRSPTMESSDEGEGEESVGSSTPPGGSSSDSLKAPPLSDVERNMRQLRRERLGTDQGGKAGTVGGGNTPAFSFRANEAKFQELENQFRQFSCTRSRRASVEPRHRSASRDSDAGEAEGSPFGRTTPGGRPLSSATRMRMRSAQSAVHRTHSPLSQRENLTGLLFPGSSQRRRPPSYSTAEHKSSPVKGGGLGSAHYLEDESSLIREERQLARDRQRVEELLYNPMTFARGVSSRRNSRQSRRDSVSGEGDASSSQSSSSASKPLTTESTPLLSSDALDALPEASSSTPLSPPSQFTRSPVQPQTNAVHTAAVPPKKKTSTTAVPSDASPIVKERPPPPPPRVEELTDEEGGSELQQLVQEEHNVRVHEVENVERIALRSILRRFPKIFADIPLLSATSPSMVSREPLEGRGNVSRKSATMEESKPTTPALWKDSVESRKERGKEPPPTATLSPPKAPPSVPVMTEEEKLFWEKKKAEIVQSEMHFRNIIAHSQHSSSAFLFLHSAEKLGRLATIALDQWERRKLAKLASLEYYQSMKTGIESSTGMQKEKWVPLKAQDKKMMKNLSSSVIKILPPSSESVSEVQSEKASQDGATHSPQGKKNKGGSGASASPRKDGFIASNTKPQNISTGSPPSVTEKRNLRKVSGLSKEELADAATLVAQTHMQQLSPPAGAETDVHPGQHHSTTNTSTPPFNASPSHSDGHASSCHSSVGSSNGVHPKAKPTISLQRSPEDEPNTSSSSLGHSAASLSGSTHPSSLTAPLQQLEEQKRRTVENEEATLFCTLMQSRAAQLHAVYQKEKENAILAALTALRMKEEKS